MGQKHKDRQRKAPSPSQDLCECKATWRKREGEWVCTRAGPPSIQLFLRQVVGGGSQGQDLPQPVQPERAGSSKNNNNKKQ